MRMNIDYSSVAAFERSKDTARTGSSIHRFTAILLAVFFIALMGGLAAGVSMYSSVVDIQSQTDSVRMESGLIASYVHVNDTADAVSRGQGPEGASLVFTERLDSGDYETRIYRHDGKIVQEYSVAGTPYTPDRAQALVDSRIFEFTVKDGLINIRTDQGTFDIAVRSAQGGDV